MTEALVEVTNLTFSYPDAEEARPALSELTFDVKKGELLAVVGPSGSGKSTLLQLLAGLLTPKKGVLRLAGKDAAARAAWRKLRGRVSLVFQYPERHFFCATVKEEVAYGLNRLGLSQQEIDERIEESLSILDRPHQRYLNRSPFELSGGEQRAVAIAVALALRPSVLLLDEPTSGLDARARRRLLDRLDTWRKAHQVGVVWVSHDMGEVSRRAERVLALKNGKQAYLGAVEDFFSNEARTEALGLATPTVPFVLNALRQRGLAVRHPLFHIEEAAAAIIEAIDS